MLMWCVQCSDPGIINRSQDEKSLPFLLEQEKNLQESGEIVMNFEDDLLSLNSDERNAVNEQSTYAETDPSTDKSLIYKESRFYQYRECTTCGI